MELGGFAETPDDIEGTEEEFIAFNYCLAIDYLDAMIDEDFELLGEVGIDTIENVVEWLNYDGEVGKNMQEQINSIPKGKLITSNNRTLEEAVIEQENLPFAEVFIFNGNTNPKLFVIAMDKAEDQFHENGNTILNIGLSSTNSQEEYLSFLKEVFDLIEDKYNKITNLEEKYLFLLRIRPHIENIRIKKQYFEDAKTKEFIKKLDYNWQKNMPKRKKETK